jgi:CBS domain-containing protein
VQGDTADAVLMKMTEGRFRHLPVLDDGKLVGLISIGDVVNARLSEMSIEKEALEGMIKGF